ncbi:SusC/RagA family TonB-linked outer membrane protein [Roseimarinus sediminis]|uniref:SusC/RagA family TonB-linked outer membrane protein n=1 Tax=Roseimarinus sediminis TaxID=1610899 RepID=UPI003D23AAF9
MKFKQKIGARLRMSVLRIIPGIVFGMIFLLSASISLPALAVSQQMEVTGKVVTADDQTPIIGATVVIKGTTRGTTTDIDGNFSIEASAGDLLLVSFIGYAPRELAAESSNMLIELEEEVTGLDEVVVIGYGVQKKKLNTGATTQMKGDYVQKLSTTSPLQAMQGQAPGINISSTSGQPGADMKVTIRGLGTVGNSGPLYIIDGIEGDITNLNASDIESIDILKDAASAAIYGSQAANGVVLVTTRKGKAGQARVSFDAYYGLQSVARTTDMLNASEYQVIMNEQALNSGSAMFPDSLFSGGDTDWVKQMFYDNAVSQNYTLGVSGGSESSVYSMSLNYLGQEGIVGGPDVSNYERYGFRINSEHQLYNGVLTFGQHLNFNYKKNNGISVGNQYNNTLRGAFTTSPIAPVFSDNNIYDSPYNDTSNSNWYKGDGNPYGSMMTNTNNMNDAQNMLADFYAELRPLKGLSLKTLAGINYYASDYRSYTPLYQFSIYSYNNSHTTVNQSMSKGHTLTWTNTANYSFDLNDEHQFDVLGGMEAIRYQGIGLSASNWNLLSQFDDFAHAYIDNTTGQAKLDKDDNGEVVGVIETKGVGGGPENQTRRLSFFGRLAYNYQEKYMLNATLRADGSSKFAAGSRWGYFPSASVGWVLTNENFMEDAAEWLTFLKIRLSWGQVGNQNIDDFQFASPINTSTSFSGDDPAANYIFGTTLVNTPGAYPSRLSNTSLKWETSEQTNVGIDAYFFDSRLAVNGDFYIKTTKDWLVQAPILATAGAGAPFINGGDVKNTGVELALSWNNSVGDLNYNVGINGAYNRNEVGNIPTEDGIIHGLTNMLYDNSEEFYRAENGHEIGYFWGYETDGIFQNEAEIAAWREAGNGILQANVKPGDVRYVDQGKDGKINTDDKVDLGSGIPDFTYGFNVGIEYKGFDFSMNANGVYGNKLVQSYRNHANKQANYSSAILQRWTGEGTSDRIPRVTETNVNWQFSDLYLHDGSYLRIQNISLGYDFSQLVKWNYLSQFRVYASVQNAFTFTTYSGMDPEIGYGTSSWVSGIDLGYYPRPRTFLLGVNVKF